MSSRPSRFATRVAALVAAFAVVSACRGRTGPEGGGQTGDGSVIPTNPGLAELARACDVDREVLTDRNAETGLGFSPNDVLDFAVSELTSTLAWTPPSERFADAEVGPEMGSGEITLTVSYDDGEVRYATPHPPAPDVTGAAPGDGPSASIAADAMPIGGACTEWIEIDVTVTIESSGGALDETFETTLVATSTLTASFSATLPVADLDGTLVVTPADGVVQNLTIEGVVSSYGTRGSLSAVIELPSNGEGDDTVVGPGYVALAEWPAESMCGADLGPALSVPSDTTWNGVEPSDVAKLVTESETTTLTWSDGNTTDLSVAVELADEACLVDSGYGASVSYPATLTLATADDRLSGTFGVLLTPTIEDQTLVSLQAFLGVSGKTEIEALGLSLEGHDEGYFSLNLTFGEEVSGSVTLEGYETPVCDYSPITDTDGGMSVGACEGTQAETLISGSWGTQVEPPNGSVRPETTDGATPTTAK